MLDALTAISLKSSSALRAVGGAQIVDPANPNIRFDYNKSDALGNPLQITYREGAPRIRDLELSKFFYSLAKISIRIKRKLLAFSVFTRKERMKQNRRLYKLLQKFYSRFSAKSIAAEADRFEKEMFLEWVPKNPKEFHSERTRLRKYLKVIKIRLGILDKIAVQFPEPERQMKMPTRGLQRDPISKQIRLISDEKNGLHDHENHT
jgi:hypothetical protein